MAIRVSEEVRHALHDGTAVVALESTIVAHGMPLYCKLIPLRNK